MYFNSEYEPEFSFYRQRPAVSYIRVLHASPDAPAVDVYANGGLIARNLSFKGFTPYLRVIPGNYNIRVFPTGKKANPVLDTFFRIPPQSIFTLVAGGRLENIGLFAVADPVTPIPDNKALIRFAHMSPNAPNVDITLPDGKVLFKNVAFRQVTKYIPVDAGNYTLQARPTETNQVALNVPNINLKPRHIYTVYAVGLVGETPPLQVLIPLDGSTYIKF